MLQGANRGRGVGFVLRGALLDGGALTAAAAAAAAVVMVAAAVLSPNELRATILTAPAATNGTGL